MAATLMMARLSARKEALTASTTTRCLEGSRVDLALRQRCLVHRSSESTRQKRGLPLLPRSGLMRLARGLATQDVPARLQDKSAHGGGVFRELLIHTSKKGLGIVVAHGSKRIDVRFGRKRPNRVKALRNSQLVCDSYQDKPPGPFNEVYCVGNDSTSSVL